jgi:outer membrane protein assembly factor BamB
MRLRATLLLACLPLIAAAQKPGGDWPQWRGPNRDGSAPAFREPKAWPERLQSIWKADVGIGYSNPVVAGDRVFIHARQGGNEVVEALDLATGKEVWKQNYPAPFKMHSAATSHGEGPKSTPAVANGRLFTLGIGGVLSAWDVKTGKRIWSKDFSKEYKETWPDFGHALSPLVEGNTVIAHVGGNKEGMLAAFDVATGAVKWKWSGDYPAYASPIVATFGGTRQIVTLTRTNAVGLDASNGTLLWKVPLTNQYFENIITPIVYEDLLILSATSDSAFAIRPKKGPSGWTTEEVWRNNDAEQYMSTPVLVGNYLYGMTHKKKGAFFCLDARTGKIQWSTAGREGDNASLVSAGNSVLILNPQGELLVIRANPAKFEELRKYQVADSATWSTPSIAGQQLLTRDTNHVALWRID